MYENNKKIAIYCLIVTTLECNVSSYNKITSEIK